MSTIRVRVRWRRLGNHVHCRVFAGHPRTTFALLGELTMDDHDWNAFTTSVGPAWEFVEDDV